VDQRDDQHDSAGRVIRKGVFAASVSESAGRCVVALSGDLDASTVDALDEALGYAEASAAEEIVVDLSQLAFMDSSGLRLILAAHARSQADSDRMRLVRGPRRVQRVFELTGMESRLPFVD
jgi:anti-anti-sigma factor